MSYRKITVEGKQYEYVIGKAYLKIKELGLFKTSEIGNRLGGTSIFVVTPGTVAKVIKKESLPEVFICERHGVTTTELAVAPYDDEIYGKIHHMINCPTCLDNNAADI